MNQKNVKYLMLGISDADIAAAGTVIEGPSSLTEGVLAIVDSTNTTVVTEQTSGKVRIVQRVGDILIYSPFIDVTKLRGKRYQAGVRPSEQVTFVGYNGTSGALADAASSDYIIKNVVKNVITTYNTTPAINHWSYRSAASTTEAAVAKGLLDSFNAWDKRNPEDILKCERVAATTSVAAFTGSAVIYKLTKGLKGVSAYIKTTDATSTFTASTVTVADGDVVHVASTNAKTFTFSAVALGAGAGRHVVYIGETAYNVADAGTAAQNGAAIVTAINAGTLAVASNVDEVVTITYTDATANYAPPMVMSTDDDSTWANVAVTAASGDTVPVKYKVDGAVTAGATFNLDTPWQGETCYLYEGTGATTTSSIGKATLNGDTFGLKFTGQALPVNGETRVYEKVRFTLGLDGDFAETVSVTYSVNANEGVGNYGQIATFEWQAQMNEGQAWTDAYPSRQHKAEANKISAVDYPLYQVILDFYDDEFTPVLGDNPTSYGTVVIATPNSTGIGKVKTVFGIS